MIEQIEKIQSSTNRHEFHCDGCGKILGVVYEDKDGKYNNIGYNFWRYHVGHEWYSKEGHYCLSCATKINTQIIESLKKVGFVKEVE